MALVDVGRQLYWRTRGHGRPLPGGFCAPVSGSRGLEIGGPSAVFGSGGLCPLYPRLSTCDGVQWASRTAWHDHGDREVYAPGDGVTGALHILEGSQLDGLPRGSWDVVLTSHVIEHLADPLGAIDAWRAALVPRGWLVMVVPHRAGTFDHRRPVTPIEHLIADQRAGTGENDLTHLDETLRLHDRSRDAEADDETWADARRRNIDTRVLHHHVFNADLVLEVLTAAGLRIHRFAVRHPHDIYVVARFEQPGGTPDNGAVLDAAAPWRRRSPFREDRTPGAS